jgi:hypothetical protein
LFDALAATVGAIGRASRVGRGKRESAARFGFDGSGYNVLFNGL